jgi:hypothetical protein
MRPHGKPKRIATGHDIDALDQAGRDHVEIDDTIQAERGQAAAIEDDVRL